MRVVEHMMQHPWPAKIQEHVARGQRRRGREDSLEAKLQALDLRKDVTNILVDRN